MRTDNFRRHVKVKIPKKKTALVKKFTLQKLLSKNFFLQDYLTIHISKKDDRSTVRRNFSH